MQPLLCLLVLYRYNINNNNNNSSISTNTGSSSNNYALNYQVLCEADSRNNYYRWLISHI